MKASISFYAGIKIMLTYLKTTCLNIRYVMNEKIDVMNRKLNVMNGNFVDFILCLWDCYLFLPCTKAKAANTPGHLTRIFYQFSP